MRHSIIISVFYLIISAIFYLQGAPVCVYCAAAQFFLFFYIILRLFSYSRLSFISFLSSYASVTYAYYAEFYMIDLPLCSIEINTNKLSCQYVEVFGYSLKALSFIGFNFLLAVILFELLYLKKEDANHP